MMMVEEKPEYLITTEKLEELKQNIPRAGPKYRLGMYFETIHDLQCFDEIQNHEDTAGYTSYYETDTELDSDFGNFIFNNVAGDSASLICIDDVDLLALRKRNEEATKLRHQQPPHYKLDQASSSSPATSPSSEGHPLERSTESKHSYRTMQSGFNAVFDAPPPVPPPRRRTSSQSTDLLDHTYETLDDCKEDYLAHQQDAIYFSKASDDSRGSQDSSAKPVSNDEDFTHPRGAEGALHKSPTCSGKPRSSSMQLPKSPEGVQYRQRRKLSEPTNNRKRRQDKVASKGSAYPAPVKGFPNGMPEDYADYLTNCPSPSERRSPVTAPTTSSPNASPCQRGFAASPERRNGSKATTAPLVIKHKGKTYVVPVVDKKLQKELEKRSKSGNPSVTVKHAMINSNAVTRSNSNSSSQNPRSFASPPKMEPCDHAPSHKRRSSSKVPASPQRVLPKQVTHYGML